MSARTHARPRTLTTLTALLVALALALAACSGGSDPGDHDDADVAFAQQMIPHHEQAVAMTDLVEGRTDDPQVLALAEQIAAEQGPEIETMTGWLEDWDAEVPSGTDAGTSGMSGMMSPADMDALAAASGARFDRLFLTMMIDHHEGAVAMAQAERADGQDPAAIDLAEGIEAAQTEEIATMRAMLAG